MLTAASVLPGIAGEAGAEQRVSDGDGDEMLVEQTVDPAVGHHVVAVAHGTACAETATQTEVITGSSHWRAPQQNKRHFYCRFVFGCDESARAKLF